MKDKTKLPNFETERSALLRDLFNRANGELSRMSATFWAGFREWSLGAAAALDCSRNADEGSRSRPVASVRY